MTECLMYGLGLIYASVKLKQHYEDKSEIKALIEEYTSEIG
jgi:hypothetical protein